MKLTKSTRSRRTKTGLIRRIYSSQKQSSRRRIHPLPTYSIDELIDWSLNNEKFNKIYNEWVNSGYKKELLPSIDRLDDYIGYSFDNIQVITWKENILKGARDVRNGVNNKKNTKVNMYNEDGSIYMTFHSQAEARRVTGIQQSNISNVCLGKRDRAGGYKWGYAS